MPEPLNNENRTVLVVEDDETTRTPIAMYLQDEGYTVYEAESAEDGLSIIQDKAPDTVISDIRFKGMNGLDLLSRIKDFNPDLPVILMTAYGTVEDAVHAMRIGAETYLTKPVRIEELNLLLDKAFEKLDLHSEISRLKRELAETRSLDRLIGNSPAMRAAFEVISQVADSNATVLIYGESGTGKELVAEALHKLSPRAEGPFQKLNCAVFTSTLLESELFGHERGAFTGAISQRKGRFELAHRGSLLLDDITVLPESIQVKLLRFLQEREFERVGGNTTLKVDVRVIASTNEPLEKIVAEGKFREDLFYRLNVIPINLPPLRDRKDDIPLLAYHFIEKHRKDMGREFVRNIDPRVLDEMIRHDWPGNVRELENWVQRALVMSHDETIAQKFMPPLGQGSLLRKKTAVPGVTSDTAGDDSVSLAGRPLADIERDAIIATLKKADGSTSRAAAMLGISARKIQYKIKQYQNDGVEIPDLKKRN